MNLTQLRYFVAVARRKSLSAAATELNISQPAITRQLKLLEAELEGILFIRQQRGVELSELGLLLLERAEFQIQSFDQMRGELRDLSFAPTGHLRIGCPPSLTRQIISGPLKVFVERHPKIRVEVREGISDLLSTAVLGDRLDVAIASTLTPPPQVASESLFREPIWLFGPPNVRLQRRVPLSLLSEIPMLLARRGNATRDLVDRRMAQAGHTLQLKVETDSTSLTEDLVKSGVGYVAAPYFSLVERVKSGDLSGAPIEGLVIDRCLIHRKDRPTSRAMREFLLLLRPEIKRVSKACKLH